MANIRGPMEQFIKEIKATSTYLEYEKQKERIKAFPELKEQIDIYREKNFNLQNSTPPDQLFDAMDAFQSEYESFREIPMVNDFLKAELDYCRMIQEINDYIFEEFALKFE